MWLLVDVFFFFGLPDCLCILVYVFILLACMTMSVLIFRGGDGRGINDGKTAVFIERVEVLRGKVGGGKLHAGEYSLNRS